MLRCRSCEPLGRESEALFVQFAGMSVCTLCRTDCRRYGSAERMPVGVNVAKVNLKAP